MTSVPHPIDRLELDAPELMTRHPPRWMDRNKWLVYDISSPFGSIHAGRIGYSRWGAMPLPASVDAAVAAQRVDVRADVYDYARVLAQPDAVEWHVNFADPNLFCAYASGLMAQDEWQVAEHPALGALLEALNARGLSARTEPVLPSGPPTPVLVTGVERRCRIDTDVNAAQGRPHGLYGGAFSIASPDAIRRATHRIDPPTISHIIAIAAPNDGEGHYTAGQITRILTTAYTGFRAAVLESKRVRGASGPVVVHSGFWGCGVFGGHRVLMSMLQMLAAEMAGVERLVMHTVNDSWSGAADAARKVLPASLAHGRVGDVREMIAVLTAMGFKWGAGDGN